MIEISKTFEEHIDRYLDTIETKLNEMYRVFFKDTLFLIVRADEGSRTLAIPIPTYKLIKQYTTLEFGFNANIHSTSKVLRSDFYNHDINTNRVESELFHKIYLNQLDPLAVGVFFKGNDDKSFELRTNYYIPKSSYLGIYRQNTIDSIPNITYVRTHSYLAKLKVILYLIYKLQIDIEKYKKGNFYENK